VQKKVYDLRESGKYKFESNQKIGADRGLFSGKIGKVYGKSLLADDG